MTCEECDIRAKSGQINEAFSELQFEFSIMSEHRKNLRNVQNNMRYEFGSMASIPHLVDTYSFEQEYIEQINRIYELVKCSAILNEKLAKYLRGNCHAIREMPPYP